MAVNIEITQEAGEDDGEIALSYNSDGPELKFAVTDTKGETIEVSGITLDQLEDFLFKAKRLVYFARYEEAVDEDEDDEDDDD